MKKIKSERGAITLFVVISIIFFVIVLVGLYVTSSNKMLKQQKELQQIQKNYETENIDDVYNRIVTKPDNHTTVTTYEQLKEKIKDQNEKYIVLANDITTSNYLTISRAVTIDLNGYTYLINEQSTESSSIIVTGENAQLTIKDSSKNETGSIVTTSTDENKKLISLENNAALVLESGAISNNNINNKDTQIIYISENSQFAMNGATIIGKITQEGTVTITAGKVIGEIFSKVPNNLSILGGIIEGKVRLLNGVSLNELSTTAKITKGTVNTYTITEDTTESKGTLTWKVNNELVTHVDVGEEVHLSVTPDQGYVVSGYKVYKENDATITVELAEDNSFIMPDYAVKIKVIYEQEKEQENVNEI